MTIFPKYTQESQYHVVAAVSQLACTLHFLTNPRQFNAGLHQSKPGKSRIWHCHNKFQKLQELSNFSREPHFPQSYNVTFSCLKHIKQEKKWKFLKVHAISDYRKPPHEESSLLLTQKSLKLNKKTPQHNRQKVYYSAINGAY